MSTATNKVVPSVATLEELADETFEPTAVRAWTEGITIFLELADGRIFGFPANRFKRLATATEEQLKEVVIEVNGYALRWDSLDEDITVPGIVAGHFELPPKSVKSIIKGLLPR